MCPAAVLWSPRVDFYDGAVLDTELTFDILPDSTKQIVVREHQ